MRLRVRVYALTVEWAAQAGAEQLELGGGRTCGKHGA